LGTNTYLGTYKGSMSFHRAIHGVRLEPTVRVKATLKATVKATLRVKNNTQTYLTRRMTTDNNVTNNINNNINDNVNDNVTNKVLEALSNDSTLITPKIKEALKSISKSNPTLLKPLPTPEATSYQLKAVALSQAVPFVGFGIMDNMIMILSGDYIDLTLGVMLGISTLCAAAVGNIISDLAGVGLGTVIEDFASRMGLPDPKLSSRQMKLRSVRFASQAGCAVGITIGCVIGMFPLLFIDSKKAEKRKKQSGLDLLFMDVVEEAKKLVGAEATTLFVVEGDELYARYVGGEGSNHIKEIRMPLGTGIAGRVALTGEPAVIYDVREEPDFNPNYDSGTFKTKSMCCVPVKDVEGRVVGVVQAINKVPPPKPGKSRPRAKKGFTMDDLGILQQISNHAAVFMQGMDEGMEELRFRDTLKLLNKGEGTGKKERKRPLHMH